MKWRINPEPEPEHNTFRRRRKFAWRKTRVGDYWVWLETYQIEEHYFKPVNGQPGWWSVDRVSPLFFEPQ